MLRSCGTVPKGEGSSPGNAAGQPGGDLEQHHADSAADAATEGQSSGGFLASTGSNFVVEVSLMIVAIIVGIMFVRRRKAA